MTFLKTHVCAVFALLLAPNLCLMAQHRFDYNANLGIAVSKGGKACLDISHDTLAAGQKIQFVNSSDPQTAGEAEILGRADQPCSSREPGKSGHSYYELRVVSGALTESVPAFALAGFAGPLNAAGSRVTADLDGDRRPESFRSCTSSEGVHLTVWKGKPLKGIRKWHYYYYLGYDVDPTCTRRDTKPASP